MPDQKDRDLVLRLKNGDERAFDSLISIYLQKSYGVALRLMGNDNDAREMIQETSIKAFNNLYRFDFNSPFGPWFTRILVNTCINQLKKNKLRRFFSLSDPDEHEGVERSIQLQTEDSPVDELIKKERTKIIENALQKIPEKQRIAIILFDIEGYSQEEVAGILNCPVGSVMSRVYYGRKRLKKLLEHYAK